MVGQDTHRLSLVRVEPDQLTKAATAEQTGSHGPANDNISLSAGEEARITPEGRVIKLALAEVDRTIAWRQRKLDFRGTPLEEVAREFNRYNRIKIQIADGPVQLKQLNGVFNADDPNALISFLQSDPQVRIERRVDVVIIEPSDAPP